MRVLIVDDDILFTRLVKTRMDKWGHAVTIVSSVDDALKRIHHEPYRLVIIDSEIPGAGAPELCRRIRDSQRSRYIYLMVFAEQHDKDQLVAALDAGADAFLVKPFNPLELRLRLRNAKRILNLEDELREGGGVDAVTELVNRASFIQFLGVVLSEARRSNTVGALMYVQVPDYTAMFEQDGYIPAQTMMSEIARILGRSVRASDLVSRLDDELFCVLLQNTFWDKCMPLAAKFTERIEHSAIYVEDIEIRPKIVVSVTNFPAGDLDAHDTIVHGERIVFDR